MCCSHQPVGGDYRSPTLVRTSQLQADLPRPHPSWCPAGICPSATIWGQKKTNITRSVDSKSPEQVKRPSPSCVCWDVPVHRSVTTLSSGQVALLEKSKQTFQLEPVPRRGGGGGEEDQ